MNNDYEVVEFKNGELTLDVSVTPNDETVWLSQKQIASLFGIDRTVVGRHIRNIFKSGELDEESMCANFAHMGKLNLQEYTVKYYNLDVILSIGYRTNSSKGIMFRKWANHILKQYMLKGYVIDTKKFDIPNITTITKLLEEARQSSGKLQLTGDDMLDFLLAYNKGLKLLDDYDHQTMCIEATLQDVYVLNYEECKKVIDQATFNDKGDLFGLEKNDSFKSAIETIYQTFDGVELYPCLEDKAANLLYLITKNHAFTDGNKRIAATIFLYFLEKNEVLLIGGKYRISNTTLATLTILVASSNPNDKESIINLIKVILFGIN